MRDCTLLFLFVTQGTLSDGRTVNLIVDFPNREEIDTAWAKEAEDRIDAYEKGKIGSKSAKEVFQEIKRR